MRSFLGTLKAKTIRYIGPAATSAIKRLFRPTVFDEVALVYGAFSSLGHKSGTMVDVGAHHGSSLASFAADGWRVIAFEPDDENRSFLVKAHGHRSNLVIEDQAVSSEKRLGSPFFRSSVSTGISGLSAFHSSHEQRQVVDVTTLAEALSRHGIERVDFLKIDTEGHDLFVLQGLNWNTVVPDVIVCEFEDRKTSPLGYTVFDLFGFLSSKNYSVIVSEWEPVVEYGTSHTWRRFLKEPGEIGSYAWGNLIAWQSNSPVSQILSERLVAD